MTQNKQPPLVFSIDKFEHINILKYNNQQENKNHRLKNILIHIMNKCIILQLKTVQKYLNDKQVKEKWLKNKLKL